MAELGVFVGIVSMALVFYIAYKVGSGEGDDAEDEEVLAAAAVYFERGTEQSARDLEVRTWDSTAADGLDRPDRRSQGP